MKGKYDLGEDICISCNWQKHKKYLENYNELIRIKKHFLKQRWGDEPKILRKEAKMTNLPIELNCSTRNNNKIDILLIDQSLKFGKMSGGGETKTIRNSQTLLLGV